MADLCHGGSLSRRARICHGGHLSWLTFVMVNLSHGVDLLWGKLYHGGPLSCSETWLPAVTHVSQQS